MEMGGILLIAVMGPIKRVCPVHMAMVLRCRLENLNVRVIHLRVGTPLQTAVVQVMRMAQQKI